MQFFWKNGTYCDWKVIFFMSQVIWRFFILLTVPLISCRLYSILDPDLPMYNDKLKYLIDKSILYHEYNQCFDIIFDVQWESQGEIIALYKVTICNSLYKCVDVIHHKPVWKVCISGLRWGKKETSFHDKNWKIWKKGYFQNFSWFQFFVCKLCMILLHRLLC